VGSITQGPGSIAQVGGTGNQATIIGAVPPPPRKLSDQELDALTRAVSGHPFTILILYIERDEEAYRLGKQIGDALVAARWTLKQSVTEATVHSYGGAPLHGMEVDWNGDAVPAGVRVPLDTSTPWGALSKELMHLFPEDFHVQPSPGASSDSIMLTHSCPN
jgi:hypothetical protein